MSSKNLKKKVIFIVDDDPGIRDVMEIILTDKGYEVVLFSDESSFSSVIKKQKPDLIFLDLRISGAEGEEITKRLKKGEATKAIPVIVVSAMVEVKKLAEEAGADDFLEKPFEIEHLLAKVSQYLD